MENLKIYLASASPRRLEILKKLFDDVEVVVSGADESVNITSPKELVTELSLRKALSVYDEISGRLKKGNPYRIIGADTVVSMDGEILGKPSDEDEARSMLRKLSGRTHEVYTGVSVVYGQRDHITFYERTEVEFIELTDEEIDGYIATGDPMDKAGAYGVQSGAAPFVCGIRGDFYNVMGLPLSALYQQLKKLTGGKRYV